MSDFTVLLERIRRGEARASEELVTIVYDELRRLAAAQLARESAAQTLQPTALVHEAWLRLGGVAQAEWQSRRHFFGAAALAMRQILIERARRRRGAKHGGGLHRADSGEIELATNEAESDSVAAVSETLDRFTRLDPEKAELVRLRYFVGLTIEETAATMDISVATAKRHWAFARAWLAREMRR
jgi:RNA polymerase sigma factor (TIGR02999 family)